MARMKQNAILVVTSALDHAADASRTGRHRPWDIEGRAVKHCAAGARGLVYGTLVLAERRSGHVIMLLVGLFAAAMPVIHMRGRITARSRDPPAASSSSGRSGRSAGSGVSPSSSRRADCGVCDGGSRGSHALTNPHRRRRARDVLGAVALSVKKGGNIHRRSGLLFVYAMLVMGASATSSASSTVATAGMSSPEC